MNNTLCIKTKDFRLLHFTFENKEQEYSSIFRFLSKIIEVDNIESLFAFEYRKENRKERYNNRKLSENSFIL